MKMQSLKPLSAILLMGLFLAPYAIIVATVVGLGFYVILNEREIALWICGIAFSASVVLSFIALRVLS